MAVGVQQAAGRRAAQVEQRPIGAGPAQHLGVEGAGQRSRLPGAAACWPAGGPAPRGPAAPARPAASTAPPVAFSPNSRALMTRVSLNTSRSPATAAGAGRGNAVHRQRCRGRRAGASRCARRVGAARSARAAGEVEVVDGVGGCARHRPGPAPAAALRGRDPAGQPIGSAARRRDGAGARRGARMPRRVRGRRQLLVRLADDSGELLLRFLNFYPSQQKALAVGQRVRARGEVRGGFLGREMVHPVQASVARHAAAAGADARLPQQRAAAAGLPAQGGGVGAGARAAWPRCCRRACCPPACPRCATRCMLPAPPAAGTSAGHAGRPQPPGLAAAEVRGAAGPAAVAAAGAAARASCWPRRRWRPRPAACATGCWRRCPLR
jgi:hypothetical protein